MSESFRPSDLSFTVLAGDQPLDDVWLIRRTVFVEEQGIPAELDPDGQDDAAFHVLVRSAAEPMGTGRLVIDDGGQGVLARIAVLPPFRGHGIARRIVQELESVAGARGVTRLSLQPHAYLEPFYESLGYRTVPGTGVVAGHDLITMQKGLRGSDGSSSTRDRA